MVNEWVYLDNMSPRGQAQAFHALYGACGRLGEPLGASWGLRRASNGFEHGLPARTIKRFGTRRQERAARPARRWRRRAGAPRRWRLRAGAPRRRRASSDTTRRPRLGPRLGPRFCVGPQAFVGGALPLADFSLGPRHHQALVAPWWRLGGALVERNLGTFLKKGPHARAERVRDGLLPARQ
jgi:hypothetical protein